MASSHRLVAAAAAVARRFGARAAMTGAGLTPRAGQRWLSTRFHPHLIAAAAGAWGVAVPIRTGYYDTKHRSLVDLGSGWTITNEPTDLSAAHEPGWPRDRVKKLTAVKADVARAIYATDSTRTHGRNFIAARKLSGRIRTPGPS